MLTDTGFRLYQFNPTETNTTFLPSGRYCVVGKLPRTGFFKFFPGKKIFVLAESTADVFEEIRRNVRLTEHVTRMSVRHSV